MGFSRARIATCFIVVMSGAVTACAAVIGIGDPALDTEGAATTPADASALGDAGRADTSPADAAANDSSPKPDAGQIKCGTATCALADGVCCSYHQTQSPPEFKLECSPSCRSPDSNADYSTALSCGRPTDCPGQKCCFTLKSGGVSTAVCKASCPFPTTPMCEPDVNNTCGTGYFCENFSSALPSSYGYCRINGG